MIRSTAEMKFWIAVAGDLFADDINGGAGGGDDVPGGEADMPGGGNSNSNQGNGEAQAGIAASQQSGTTAALASALAPATANMPDSTTVGNFNLNGPVVAARSYSLGTGPLNVAQASNVQAASMADDSRSRYAGFGLNGTPTSTMNVTEAAPTADISAMQSYAGNWVTGPIRRRGLQGRR